MRYAPVMPPSCITLLDSIKCDAYFCFADVALRNTEYLQWFRDKPNIILDNPIVEHGEIASPSEMRLLVKVLQPDFAFIPDAQFDRKATLSLMTNYLAACDSTCMAGVPQGSTVEEQIECAKEMYSYGLRRMGIVRQSERNGNGSRADIIRRLHDLGMNDVAYHLLGARWPYSDEIACATYGLAVSVDTAEPINASYLAYDLLSRATIVKRPEKFLRFTVDDFHLPLLEQNIRTMQKWMMPSAQL